LLHERQPSAKSLLSEGECLAKGLLLPQFFGTRDPFDVGFGLFKWFVAAADGTPPRVSLCSGLFALCFQESDLGAPTMGWSRFNSFQDAFDVPIVLRVDVNQHA